MRRRSFLAGAIGACGLLASRMATLARGGGRERIVVVGAGMAGIAAARELVARGYEVVVLEGRQRIGGRIWTDVSLGTPIDMGAAWIHGVDGNPMTKLAEQLSLATRATDYENLHAFDRSGAPVDDETVAEVLHELESVLEKLAKSSRDRSVGDAIKQALAGETLSAVERRAVDWAMAILVATTAENLDALSARHLDEGEEYKGGDRLFLGGYHAIAAHLAAGLDIRLGHRVTAIAYDATGVTVETSQGSFRGARAIITLPLGVLKAGTISFHPVLPEAKRRAVRLVGMGVLDKVALRFPRAFWPTDRHFLGHFCAPDRGIPAFLNMRSYGESPILVGYLGGQAARAIEPLTDEAAAAEAMRALRTMFGARAVDPERVLVSRWASDPMSGGSYSHLPVGADPSERDFLAQPVGQRLLFAGEATSRSHPGTVHGAYLSGLREARRISRA